MPICDDSELERIVDGKRIKILYLGRLIYKRAVDVVIYAFHNILRLNHDMDMILIIAGDGEEKYKLLYLVKELGISDKVLFLGAIREEKKACLYRLADIFVYVPRLVEIPEEYPIPPLEAMQFGVPTIVSNIVGSIPEIADAVLIVEQNNVKSLEKALLQLVYNLDLRKKLSKMGIAITKDLINENKVYMEFIEVIINSIRK